MASYEWENIILSSCRASLPPLELRSSPGTPPPDPLKLGGQEVLVGFWWVRGGFVVVFSADLGWIWVVFGCGGGDLGLWENYKFSCPKSGRGSCYFGRIFTRNEQAQIDKSLPPNVL